MSFVGPPAVLAWLMLISFVAGTAKGVSGFGAALLMAPLFGLLIKTPDAGALIVLVHCATSLQGARRWAGTVRWRSVVPLALFAMACAALTTHWITSDNAAFMRHLVALSVLAATGVHMTGWRWRHNGGWVPTFTAGALSGALTALGGVGGPPAVYYFNGISHGPALRANLLGYFAVLFSGVTLIMVESRQIRLPQIWTTALLIPAFVIGVRLGEGVSNRLPLRWFNRIVSGMLLGSGLVALLA